MAICKNCKISYDFPLGLQRYGFCGWYKIIHVFKIQWYIPVHTLVIIQTKFFGCLACVKGKGVIVCTPIKQETCNCINKSIIDQLVEYIYMYFSTIVVPLIGTCNRYLGTKCSHKNWRTLYLILHWVPIIMIKSVYISQSRINFAQCKLLT